MNLSVAKGLKKARNDLKLHVDDVIELLQHRNFDIKAKTLYSYESGNSMPNADIFLALCDIYQIPNILYYFGYGDAILPDFPGRLLFSVPLFNAIYCYCEDRGIDFRPIFKFILAPENNGGLSAILSRSSLPAHMRLFIEDKIGCNLETMLLNTGLQPEEAYALTLTREEVEVIKALRSVKAPTAPSVENVLPAAENF